MCELHGLGDLQEQPCGFAWLQRTFGNLCRKTIAFDKPHREEMLALVLPHFKDRHDPGMIQIRRRFGFGVEPPHVFLRCQLARQNHLDRNNAVEPYLSGFVDDTHAAPSDLAEQFVIAEITNDAAGPCARFIISRIGRPLRHQCGVFGRQEARHLQDAGLLMRRFSHGFHAVMVREERPQFIGHVGVFCKQSLPVERLTGSFGFEIHCEDLSQPFVL